MKNKIKKKIYIIAEAGVNHNGNINIAKKMIKEAKLAGADCIKFQAFEINKLVSDNAKSAIYQKKETSKSLQKNVLKGLSFSKNNFKILFDECKKQKIEFLCTAFDADYLKYLISIGMKAIKIPSGEINNFPYLKEAAEYNLPIYFSTGMSNLVEVKRALKLLQSKKNSPSITILHCTSLYPAPENTLNLLAINTLHKKFKIQVGYSDHSLGDTASIAAVAMGAQVIEKHFTLNKNYSGPDQSASATTRELKNLIDKIRFLEKALGDGTKIAHKKELDTLKIARKSWHAKTNIIKETILKNEDLILIRPGIGIPGDKNIIGFKAIKNIKKGELIKKSWIKEN